LPVRDRANLLLRTADVLRNRRFELAAWEVLEVGKSWREADADVAEAIDYLEYYAREAVRLADPARRDVFGERNTYRYEPRGVAVAITPWNFPLAILTGVTAAACVTCNTVIMKPAEQSSVTAAKLMEAWREAGAPTNVIQYVPGRGEGVGEYLVRHPGVNVVGFTGSVAAGLRIQNLTARVSSRHGHIKRVIAEMGGKNAIIVDRTADLDEAVCGVARSAFDFQGQKCSACSRAIVHRDVYGAFLERLVEAARSLAVGPPWDPHFALGPLIDEEAVKRVEGYVNGARGAARIYLEANVGHLAREGHYVGPVIFADVGSDLAIAQEEVFGPVLCVLRAENLDEAIALANGTAYGLTGGLYSRDPDQIRRVQAELEVGNVYVNRKITGALVDRQPFGGRRLSGIGSKTGGPDYLLQFMQPKTVTEWTVRHGFAPPAE
jgi:RHH-type proline utilization regulon transcriptional repressor/proline dehydrogenase/delta 1-pyrroline-5-carboxylate dehydrogenase